MGERKLAVDLRVTPIVMTTGRPQRELDRLLALWNRNAPPELTGGALRLQEPATA